MAAVLAAASGTVPLVGGFVLVLMYAVAFGYASRFGLAPEQLGLSTGTLVTKAAVVSFAVVPALVLISALFGVCSGIMVWLGPSMLFGWLRPFGELFAVLLLALLRPLRLQAPVTSAARRSAECIRRRWRGWSLRCGAVLASAGLPLIAAAVTDDPDWVVLGVMLAGFCIVVAGTLSRWVRPSAAYPTAAVLAATSAAVVLAYAAGSAAGDRVLFHRDSPIVLGALGLDPREGALTPGPVRGGPHGAIAPQRLTLLGHADGVFVYLDPASRTLLHITASGDLISVQPRYA